mgnify:CR=1 FL=1
MPSIFFEDILKYELEIVQEIREWPAFSVQRDEGNKKKSFWNAFNLVPNAEEDGIVKGSIYTNKIICKFAEQGSGLHTYEEYYEDFPLSEVWEELALNRAINYY